MRWLALLLLLLPSIVMAQPACVTGVAPGAIACQAAAVNLLPADILLGQQARGPNRANQTVRVSVQQLVGVDHSLSPVTGNGITNLLSTWMGYLAGVANPNPINVSSALGYRLNSQNAYRIGSTNPYAIWIGMFAGASAVSANQLSMGAGSYAFESMDGVSPENTAFGIGAGIAVTSAGGITTMGTASCAGITTVGNVTCIGNDAGRDYVSQIGGDVLLGTGAGVDGSPANPNIAIGSLALHGAAGTITIGGTLTAGDQLKFTFTTTNPCNGTSVVVNCTTSSLVAPFNWTNQSVTYTVTGGDTLASVATNAAALIAVAQVNYVLADGVLEGSHNLFAFGASVADPANHPTVIIQHFPSSWAVTTTYSCTGTCGETATITGATAGGDNVIAGTSTLGYPGAVTPLSNVLMGNHILTDLAISPQFNVILGSGTVLHGVSPQLNVIGGYNSTTSCVNCSENVILGSWTGIGLTSNNNTIVGDQAVAGQNCITSGGQNMELGYGSCVPSPTTAYQLSIQNAIYGTGNSGSGATISPGQIGIAIKAPTATFTVGDAGGTSTQGAHIAIVQTTAPTCTNCTLDSNASDVSGVITGGTSQTTLTVGFNKTFANTPHCVVSAMGASTNLSSYTISTTQLVLTTPSLTGAKYAYVCMQ